MDTHGKWGILPKEVSTKLRLLSTSMMVTICCYNKKEACVDEDKGKNQLHKFVVEEWL